jgi:hypothetical protein
MTVSTVATRRDTQQPAWRPALQRIEPLGILFVIFGGLVILQSSQQFNILKVIYLLGFALATITAVLRIRELASTDAFSLAKPLLIASAVFTGYLLASLAVALAHGTPFTSWLRDVAPYLLFAATPLFAVHANSCFTKRQLLTLLILLGLLGTIAYIIEWLGPIRRNYASLPVARLGLSSLYLPAALFSYGITSAVLWSRRRLIWIGLVGLVGGSIVVTGTRRGTVMLIAGLPALVVAARLGMRKLLQAVAVVVACAVVLAVVGLVMIRTLHLNYTSYLMNRFENLPAVVINPSKDLSIRDHAALNEAAWNVFTASPVTGAGPGKVLNWTGYSAHSGFSTIDTALGFPAKFGILGTLVLLLLLGCLLMLLRNLLRIHGPTPAVLALLGFLLVAGAVLVLELPLEDKGFSFAFLTQLALSLPSDRKAAAIEVS